MLKRVITAIVAICVLIPCLILSDTVIFPIACGIVALIALYEITGCIGVRKKWLISGMTFLYGALVSAVVTAYFVGVKNSAEFYSIFSMEKVVVMVFGATFAYIFLTCCFTMLSLGEIKFLQAAELITWTLYIMIGIMSIALLRRQGDAGVYLYGLIFIGAWMTDTGAYFVGVLFGKHKLIPKVSPKKTIEGAFGGILGCIVGFVLYGFIIQSICDVKVNYVAMVVLATVIAVVSQFGDLVASYIKREREIKDFGFIFPGHGGVLDRFDSIIAVAPTIYFITYFTANSFPIFTC
jgi:phosphatidate cytidylyltransferase